MKEELNYRDAFFVRKGQQLGDSYPDRLFNHPLLISSLYTFIRPSVGPSRMPHASIESDCISNLQNFIRSQGRTQDSKGGGVILIMLLTQR